MADRPGRHEADNPAATYRVLRYGGTPPSRAAQQLNLTPSEASALERAFQADNHMPWSDHGRHLHSVRRQQGVMSCSIDMTPIFLSSEGV